MVASCPSRLRYNNGRNKIREIQVTNCYIEQMIAFSVGGIVALIAMYVGYKLRRLP